MKKIFIFGLIFLMMFPLIGAQAAQGNPSATIYELVQVNPKIAFEVLHELTPDLLSEDILFMILQWYYPRVKFNRFHLDEVLILHLDRNYQQVSWRFIEHYKPSNSVYALFVNENYTMVVRKGTISSDSWVTFDFSGLDVGQVVMYVISNY